MNMKKKLKKKLEEVREQSTSESPAKLDLWENARHAIDIVQEGSEFFLVVVKYNDLQGQVVNRVSLGDHRAKALQKAGFILGDKVLRKVDINKEFVE